MKKFFLIFFIFNIFFIINNFLFSEGIFKEKIENLIKVKKPKYIRGIHASAWAVSSKKFRDRYDNIFKNTEINTLVIGIKEANGEVYIDDIEETKKIKAFRKAIPDLKNYIDELHKLDIFIIARIVLFKDPIFSKFYPKFAIKNKKTGNIWRDYKGNSWVNPFCKEVWEYNYLIVNKAIELGFDEIQFDYIRYPSDGPIKQCDYSINYSSSIAINNIIEFLKETKKRFGERVRISIDTFGLTTSAIDDMGIGQNIKEFEPFVDVIYPMIYPSHYKANTYGLINPNKSPYLTVFKAIKAGKNKLKKNSYKFIPYLQDFSIRGYKYGVKEIREQIQALYDNDIPEWILWDPKALYTIDALKEKSEQNKYKNLKKEKLNKENKIKIKENIIENDEILKLSEIKKEIK